MAKPLFRWTVGPCTQQGLDILAESVVRTPKALGVDKWDWVICYNDITPESLKFLEGVVAGKPIHLMPQVWAHVPINDNCQSPRRMDGTFEFDGRRTGGSLWKVCPARMRMETHEIIMDNDVVLLKKFPQIDEFLASRTMALVLEEPIRFYGRYDCLFPKDDPNLNSGFMGMPPGFDFGAKIYESWVRYGSYQNLSQADEQGLLTFSLNQIPNIRIKKEQMVEVLHRDYNTKITGREEGIHFTQSNRMPNHHSWNEYNKLAKHF